MPASFFLRLRTLALGLLASATLAHAAAPTGELVMPADPAGLLYEGPGDHAVVSRLVRVTGQDFAQAREINTLGLDTAGGGLRARINRPVKKGDVLWISLKVRALEARRESGEAYFELRIEQLIDGKYRWPAYLERAVWAGPEWTEISIPYVMEKDVTPETMRLSMNFDRYPQRFQIGPVTFLNCGPDVAVSALPRTVVTYDGSAPDAAWRAEAAARIEKFRKGDLALRVVGHDGQPVPSADVQVRMKRLGFNLGVAVNSARLLDTQDPDALRYQEIVTNHFNHVVFENEMKWNRWSAPNHTPEPTLRALDWLDARGITARGHVMIWPSWRHLPKYLSEFKDDPARLRAEVFKNIALQTKTMNGRFVQWDVSNELYAHHDLLDLLGWDELVAWYKAAHAGDPRVRLFYNEYTLFYAPGNPGPDHFYNTVRMLLDKGAPVHGIGEQAHIGGTPPGIPRVLERLERFSGLGLPIVITEFDLSSNDQDFQAAYLRDFMTAVFSQPATAGIVQWGFWESAHYYPNAALWNKDWSIRKHGQAYLDLVAAWRTDATRRTTADGSFATRAFHGDYEVTVTHDGKTRTFPLHHAPGEAAKTLTLSAD